MKLEKTILVLSEMTSQAFRPANDSGVSLMHKSRCISIVTSTRKTARLVREQIASAFRDSLDFQECPLDEEESKDISGDVVLIPDHTWARRVSGLVAPTVPLVCSRRTITREGWKKIESLPRDSKALLVNNMKEAALETVSIIYELGARHLDLIPVYPGSAVPDVDLAITPGEVQYVPKSVKHIIDIGNRIVDAGTLLTIADLIGIAHVDFSVMIDLLHETIPLNPGLLKLIELYTSTKQQLNLVRSEVAGFKHRKNVAYLHPRDGRRSSDPVRPVTVAGWAGDSTHRVTNGGHIVRYTFGDIVGRSPAITRSVQMARRFAKSDAPVLIYGSTGTGKELFANSIHAASKRSSYPFVAINCAALPENLLESELFGYEEGAFTGARKGGKPGLFDQADGGTVFLDEIGDLSQAMQSKILRVLEEKSTIRIGGTAVRWVDIRLICATNKDIAAMVKNGAFRSDLFFRIYVLTMRLPDLRDRLEDLPDLVDTFMKRQGVERKLSPDVFEVLASYDWPGNVRELDNCIQYMLAVSENRLDVTHVPPYILEAVGRSRTERHGFAAQLSLDSRLVLDTIQELIDEGKSAGRRSIASALRKSGCNMSEARIRKVVQFLRDAGYVSIGLGRKGISIDSSGYAD